MNRLAIALLSSLCATASAQITPLAQFAGAFREGFEYYPQPGNLCLAPAPFAGFADVCGTNADEVNCSFWFANYTNCGAGQVSCTTYPHLGSRLLTASYGRCDITFRHPVKRVGAWFSHSMHCNQPNDVVEFLDADGALLHTASIAIPANCGWVWFGWESASTPIRTLRFNPNAGWTTPILGIDDMEVDYFPESYCVAGVTGNGCRASIRASDHPDVAHASPCVVSVSGVEGQRSGILFYSLATQLQPWCVGGSSYLCIRAPTQRSSAQSSGGASGSCDGTLTLDWSAYQLANPTALGAPWLAGERAHVQAWFRDPASCKTTALSDALTLTYRP